MTLSRGSCSNLPCHSPRHPRGSIGAAAGKNNKAPPLGWYPGGGSAFGGWYSPQAPALETARRRVVAARSVTRFGRARTRGPLLVTFMAASRLPGKRRTRNTVGLVHRDHPNMLLPDAPAGPKCGPKPQPIPLLGFVATTGARWPVRRSVGHRTVVDGVWFLAPSSKRGATGGPGTALARAFAGGVRATWGLRRAAGRSHSHSPLGSRETARWAAYMPRQVQQALFGACTVNATL